VRVSSVSSRQIRSTSAAVELVAGGGSLELVGSDPPDDRGGHRHRSGEERTGVGDGVGQVGRDGVAGGLHADSITPETGRLLAGLSGMIAR